MKNITRTFEELSQAGFREIPRTFPQQMFKEDKNRVMIYLYVGVDTDSALFRQMYDGERRYVEGLLKGGDK